MVRWRIQFSAFKFDIFHRLGKVKSVADTPTRNVQCCNSVTTNDNKLVELRNLLCHPEVARVSPKFVRVPNLPYSVENIKKITQALNVYAQLKPKFYCPLEESIARGATLPFERLNIDFKPPFLLFLGSSIF